MEDCRDRAVVAGQSAVTHGPVSLSGLCQLAENTAGSIYVKKNQPTANSDGGDSILSWLLRVASSGAPALRCPEIDSANIETLHSSRIAIVWYLAFWKRRCTQSRFPVFPVRRWSLRLQRDLEPPCSVTPRSRLLPIDASR